MIRLAWLGTFGWRCWWRWRVCLAGRYYGGLEINERDRAVDHGGGGLFSLWLPMFMGRDARPAEFFLAGLVNIFNGVGRFGVAAILVWLAGWARWG